MAKVQEVMKQGVNRKAITEIIKARDRKRQKALYEELEAAIKPTADIGPTTFA